MPPVGFEPAISAGERPQTYALDRAATGIGTLIIYYWLISDVFKTLVKLVSKPSHVVSSNKVELKKNSRSEFVWHISSVRSEDIGAVRVGFVIKTVEKGRVFL